MNTLRSVVGASFLALSLVFCAPALAQQPDDASEGEEPKNEWIVLPNIAASPEEIFRFGLYGLIYFPTKETIDLPEPSSLRGEFYYTLRRQARARARYVAMISAGKYVFDTDLFAEDRPDRYYGEGNDTTDDFNIIGSRRIRSINYFRRALDPDRRMLVGLIYDFASVSIDPTEQRDPEDINNPAVRDREQTILQEVAPTGIDGGRRSGIGAEFLWDLRDNGRMTRNGTFLNARLMQFAPFLGSTFDYGRLFLDGRAYKDLGRDHVVAVRGVTVFGWGDYPFFDIDHALIGGSYQTRGIFRGRYRSNNAWSFEAEYRTPLLFQFKLGPLKSGFRFSAFGSAGQVAEQISDFSLRSGLRWAVGAGTRVKLTENIFVRVDYAQALRGDRPDNRLGDGTGFYIDINESW